jgi:exodeoxyribonuclease-3
MQPSLFPSSGEAARAVPVLKLSNTDCHILTVGTWNVNGIRARQAQVLEWMERDRPDVVCLQEIKAAPDQIPPALCEIEGYWCYWHGSGGYSGVGLHVSKAAHPEPPSFVHPGFDYENRIVLADVAGVTIASVYVPNGGKDFPAKMRFLAALEQFVAGLHAELRPVLLCGDLNIARADIDVHPKERKPTAVGQLPEERALLEQIISHGLVDVGRALAPDDDQMFTWWAPWRNLRQRNIGWRLDYLLASQSLFDRVLSCVVQKEVGTSDHAPVVGVFQKQLDNATTKY